MLTLEQALTLLRRMQAAAPQQTAAKLNDISQLLLSLSEENQALQRQAGEAAGGANAAEEVKAAHILTLQLSEALQPRLQVVNDTLDPLLNGAYGALTEAQQTALETIRAQVRGGIDLLHLFEDLIALRHGLLDVTPLVFSPAILIREVEREMLPVIRERGQTLEASYPDPEWSAEGDYRRILGILSDLVDNASRYTPQGGVIRLSAEHLGTHVLFSVADNGIGLRPEDLKCIGEPFWRATDQPLVQAHQGSGLRLHLAREILKLLQGELIFSGEPGAGSTFSFTLPAAV
ncbi:MAG: ATP-binding protein [Chloroflexota bacterium]